MSANEESGNDSQAADAMILELEALMADVDKAQKNIDSRKEGYRQKETDLAMTEDNGAGECPIEMSPPAVEEEEEEEEGKRDPESIFRELEGLTSMMDSVTQSLISARDGTTDCGGGEEGAHCVAGSSVPNATSLTADSSLASFLEAFEGVVGSSPLNVPPPAKIEELTLSHDLKPIISSPEVDSTPTPAPEVVAASSAPEVVAPSSAIEAKESVTTGSPNDGDSLPLTTSFMTSSGALPPGATAVDFNPLAGSAAASLTVSQMSNEGLASSVEGLNISQISNEGMATSAVIDSVEIPVEIPFNESPKESEAPSEFREILATDLQVGASKLSPENPRSPENDSASTGPTDAKAADEDVGLSASNKVGKKKSPLSAAAAKASVKSAKKNKKGASPVALNTADANEASPVIKETPEAVMKSLHGCVTPEAKLQELSSRHAATLTQNRELEAQIKLEQRRNLATLKEKEVLSSDHQKALLAKSKLESLCRELQKHSKMVKDESMKRAQIEEAKRKEVADSFQSTIEEVTNRMQNNSERNHALREQNEELASKMKHLVEQYEKREAHIEKILKHKDLEQQLGQAKLDKAEAEKKEIVEKTNKEREMLMGQTLESVKRTQVLEQNEKHLRAQIELYTEKYDEFQSTLAKSNTVFNNFKSEMAQMTKKIKKLEKEIQMWRGKWETSNTQLEKVTKEKESTEAELKETRNKSSKLEKLCRALQQERHNLSSQMSKLSVAKDALGNNVASSEATGPDAVDNAVETDATSTVAN